MSVRFLMAQWLFKQPPTILYGMKRSGNHAFVRWFRSGTSVFHINNPFYVGRYLQEPESYQFPLEYRSFQEPYVFRKVRESGLRRVRPLITVEDFPVTFPFFNNLKEARRIVLVRDPENLFASRIKKGFTKNRFPYPTAMNDVMERAIDVWMEHAKELVSPEESGYPTISVYYDRWITDADYRNDLARRLDLVCCPPLPTERASEGDGSSFSPEAVVNEKERAGLTMRAKFLDEREKALLDDVMATPRLRDMQQRLSAAFSMQ